MSRSLLSRIEKLEAKLPRGIELILDDGTSFHHSGPPLQFAMECRDQMNAGGGPIVDAVMRTVDAKGCGLLWQLLAAVWRPVSDEM
jgi:hypothetical protein